MLTVLAECPYLKSEWKLFPIVWHWDSLMDNSLFPQNSVFLSPWKTEMEVCACGWKPKEIGWRWIEGGSSESGEWDISLVEYGTITTPQLRLSRGPLSGSALFGLDEGATVLFARDNHSHTTPSTPWPSSGPHWASPETRLNLQKSAKLKFIHMYAIIHYTSGSTLDIFILAKKKTL